MKLYNETRTELKDAKSIFTAETVLIYFSADENDDNFIEIEVSEDGIEVLDSDCTDAQMEVAFTYAERAVKSINDYNNF